ncbi:uncharacterized protein LOC120355030 [Nilaparvata lugens]|uniref:uncharacterized protein LOC120355030 n=1 Tax=Nilaparvata lugens TaxID=108931 RepID=UPI00193CCBEB|nr:uncharacterized protein LOC120355030 [Nilaparvata lugens]XP_039299205.1 uncharacterized protein LOC120355030 [Nilaparvata lugens]
MPRERRLRGINSAAARHRINLDEEDIDITSVLESSKRRVFDIIREHAARYDGNVKWFIVLNVLLYKLVVMDDKQVGDSVSSLINLHSYSNIALNVLENYEEFNEHFMLAVRKILSSFENFVRHGSGWVLKKIESLDVNVIKFNPIYTSSFIQTPQFLKNKKCIINVKNLSDEKCFLWSVLAYFHQKPRNSDLSVKYLSKFAHTLNTRGVNFPVTTRDIKKFEILNPDIAIHVIAYDNKKFFPFRTSIFRTRKHQINLLMLKGDAGKTHFCLVNTANGKNGLSRLLCHLSKHKGQVHVCNFCFHRFTSNKSKNCDAEANLLKHVELCSKFESQRVSYPKRGETIKFKKLGATLKKKYTIYADLETYVVNIDNDDDDDSDSDEITRSYTKKTARHIPCGYCFVVIDVNGEIAHGPVLHRSSSLDEKIMEKFLQEITDLGDILYEDMKREIPMQALSESQEREFQNSVNCGLCAEPFLDSDIKCRHHAHETGNYLCAAHVSCNLTARTPEYISCYFHNFSGFDSHFILKSLGKCKKEISCIANTSERFLTLSVGKIKFLDSYKFMSESLEVLVRNLVESTDMEKKFERLFSVFDDPPREHRQLLLKKGVYPYSYMSCPEKFAETSLPPIECFHNDLTDTPLSREEYEHAQRVFSTFKLKNLGEYHDFYLCLDVMLLAVVFESMRSTLFSSYGLDVTHFVSLAHFTWNCMLKHTKVELELLTHPDMHLMFEAGMRGGVSFIGKRYCEANNKHLPETYDPSKPSNYLLYIDANSLYSEAMSRSLPVGNFKFLSEEEISSLDFANLDSNSETGYIIECDLKYPQELHDKHASFPLAPLHQTPPRELLSNYQTNENGQTGTKKLMNTLFDREKYIVHYVNLKLYLQLGLKLLKVHRVISFSQSPWLKSYIDFNIRNRQNAKNKFEISFFKACCNLIFGKTIQSSRKQMNVKIITDEKRLDKYISNPLCKRWQIISPNVIAVFSRKLELKMNKPVYSGFSVLELSKFHMYDFFYCKLQKIIPWDRIELCMTDTDSFLLNLKVEDVYQLIRENLTLFDTSNYPPSHPCFSMERNKVVGKFKDETGSKPVHRFLGLRSKLYSYLVCNENEELVNKCIAKGVQSGVKCRKLNFNLYMKSLFERSEHVEKLIC